MLIQNFLEIELLFEPFIEQTLPRRGKNSTPTKKEIFSMKTIKTKT